MVHVVLIEPRQTARLLTGVCAHDRRVCVPMTVFSECAC